MTLPANGRYVVAVWHPQGELGRYGFVIGDKNGLAVRCSAWARS